MCKKKKTEKKSVFNVCGSRGWCELSPTWTCLSSEQPLFLLIALRGLFITRLADMYLRFLFSVQQKMWTDLIMCTKKAYGYAMPVKALVSLWYIFTTISRLYSKSIGSQTSNYSSINYYFIYSAWNNPLTTLICS